jgi:hypothetical protein
MTDQHNEQINAYCDNCDLSLENQVILERTILWEHYVFCSDWCCYDFEKVIRSDYARSLFYSQIISECESANKSQP